MSTTDLRASIARMQDGMTINREKLAREGLAVCDSAERLQRQLDLERQKTEQLTQQLAAAVKGQSSSDIFSGMGGGLGDAFKDLFKPTGQSKT